MKAEVLILDDHASYLRVLKSAAETRGFKVIGTESSTGAAIQTCSRVQPDVIVVDLHLDSDSDGYPDADEAPPAPDDEPWLRFTGLLAQQLCFNFVHRAISRSVRSVGSVRSDRTAHYLFSSLSIKSF